MKIAVIPLDERPVNTRYPAMIAAIAGAEVVLPPSDILSTRRNPGDCIGLANWAAEIAAHVDGLIVSCEMLGYGGLIASRTSTDGAAKVLARLERLRDIRRNHPKLPIYGFNVVTRVSNANDAVEEPEYWQTYGERLYAFSQLLDQRPQGWQVDEQLGRLVAEIPAEHRRDMIARRLRNHIVNLAALELLADGVFDLLVLSSDDTSPYGLPTREKRWLSYWAGLTEPGERLLMYPGADEVGSVLVARLLNRTAGVTPIIWARYAPPEAKINVAAYEDGPISQTVEQQIVAVGGRQGSDNGDIWLAVNAPLARRGEWNPTLAEAEQAERQGALEALVGEAQWRQAANTPVAIADVAYPNGADPALTERLLNTLDLPKLASYGAWNTAGNTIGTVLAQSCMARLIATPAGHAAHKHFLAHRLIEDWGYQRVVRAEIRRWLTAEYGSPEPVTPIQLAETCARIEAQLNTLIDELPGFAGRLSLAPGSVRLPWNRTFEVDFDLLMREKGGSVHDL